MSEPFERIRAALNRTTATRAPEGSNESKSQLPVIAISTENLEMLLGSGKPKDPATVPEVEVLLPLLAASDEERVSNLAGSVEVVVNPEPAAHAEAVPAADQSIVQPVEVAPEPALPLHADAAILAPEPVAAEPVPAPQETVAEPSVIHAKSTENQEKSAVAPVVIKPTAIPVEPKSDAEAPIAAVTEPKSGIVPVSNIGSTLFAEGPPPMTEEEMTRRESRKQFLSWIAPGVILLLLASGTTTYLLISRQSKPQPAPTVQASAPAVLPQPLHLDVELQANGQINVRWNSSADKVANAREGRLVVTEEDQAERVMPLNKAQLAIGHFSYQPSRERIEFRLEVLDMNGSVTQESVLAMSPKVAAAEVTKPAEIITGGASAAKNSATPTAAQSTSPSTTGSKATPKSDPPKPVEAAGPAESAPSRASARVFSPPANNNSEIRTVILEPPAIATGGVAALPAGVSASANVSSFAAAPPPTPAAPVAAAKPVAVGGNIQAGLLVKRVTPEYPTVARASRVQGTVRFSAVIGKDGRIQDLRPLTGPSLLIPPAQAAVKQWVYRPTMLNGQPVEVSTQIDVNFTLGQ